MLKMVIIGVVLLGVLSIYEGSVNEPIHQPFDPSQLIHEPATVNVWVGPNRDYRVNGHSVLGMNISHPTHYAACMACHEVNGYQGNPIVYGTPNWSHLVFGDQPSRL